MSEAEKVQGGPTSEKGEIGGNGDCILTQKQRELLEALYSVLPILINGPKKPLGDPSLLPAQEPAPGPDEEDPSLQSSSSQLSLAESQEDELLIKARREINTACWGLDDVIRKFWEIENRICAVEGGAQLVEALMKLGETARECAYTKDAPKDIRTLSFSFIEASDTLIGAFKNIGEGFIKDKHIAPLRELSNSCFDFSERYEQPTLYLALNNHIDKVTKSLSEVFDTELPEFLKARERAFSIDYNNMLTAATFFSAVTATTLQLSYAYDASSRASLGVAVNTLWFVALVFSTASSLNSLVGLTWYKKIRRDQTLPDWVKMWIECGPTISLAVASAAFSAGLCLFAFSSSQHIITSALTGIFTVLHAVALFAPLCLYSPNSISRFLLKAFTIPFFLFREFCLRCWYLRGLPRQDKDRLEKLMRYSYWTKTNVIAAQRELEEERALERKLESETVPNAVPSSTGYAILDPSSRLIGVIKRKIKKARMFVRSVFAWPITRQPDWLTLHRREAGTTQEPNNMEQVQIPDEKVATRSKLERVIESQGDTGEPEALKSIATGSQCTAIFQGPRTPIFNATSPDQSAALAADGSGEEAGRSFDTHPTLESAKEPYASTSSTTNPIYGASSLFKVQDSDNDLEDVERQETDAPGRLIQLQEDEQRPLSDCSVRERAEENNVGTSNSAPGGRHGNEGIVREGRPSDQDQMD